MKYAIQLLLITLSLQSWAEFRGDHSFKEYDRDAANGAASNEIYPYTTDGCSRFIDADVKTYAPWLVCCEMHDIAYWSGLGGVEGHRRADADLYSCVKKKTNIPLAFTFWSAVRAASPLNRLKSVPTEYRWGFGWPYALGNDSLNEKQKKSVQEQLPSILPSIDARRQYYKFVPLTQEERKEVQERIDKLNLQLIGLMP